MPEWLPEYRQVELGWLKKISSVFESFGYMPIETGAFERLETLISKGEIDKEVYMVSKTHGEGVEKYGLHYDLTVPFARYVAQNYNALSFPFKRYQAQKVWRGERPQKGRFREFYQCDIDVVDNGSLSNYFDFEVLMVGEIAMSQLGIPAYTIGVSNRKIYEGYLQALQLQDPVGVLRVIDKMDKIGREGVLKVLHDTLQIPVSLAERALGPSDIRSKDLGFVDAFKSLGISSEWSDLGIKELSDTYSALLQLGGNNFMADLSFVRGLEYYTGTIFEGKFNESEGFGSICSGGRYENLTGKLINKKLPGVGFSIGLTRIFAKMMADGTVKPERNNIVDSIILRTRDNDIKDVAELANILRNKGQVVEIYHEHSGISKQFKYAGKKGIQWVWIESEKEPGLFEVKNMNSGEQLTIRDPQSWNF